MSGDSAPDAWAAVAETHSGAVFFAGDRAYKVKKPVDLGFLDFTTLGARAEACRREVELNRRLAPDVYLGVATLLDPDGRPCEHLVVMRRMPADRRLSSLVLAGADVDAELWRLAHLIASFHAGARRGPQIDAEAGAGALAGRWAVNAADMAGLRMDVLDPEQVEATAALAQRYLDGRAALFDERIADGRACDGHGDLLADDIFCLDDGPRVLDCLEFDDRLRYGDALADVAFLAMDLERLGRPDLADRFLSAYREHADDTWPASLAHHHVAYRAQVRAKVTAIRAEQGHPELAGEARSLLDLARRHLEAARVRLVLVGGLPGTGKSTLAAGLAARLGATVLRSDEIRKELAGVPALMRSAASYGRGIYDPATTRATYECLLARAEVALGRGESVVLDASWQSEGWRVLARRLATDVSADLAELRCEVPVAVAAARIEARRAVGEDPSDATVDVARAMAARFESWPGSAPVSTSGSPGESVDAAMALLAGA